SVDPGSTTMYSTPSTRCRATESMHSSRNSAWLNEIVTMDRPGSTPANLRAWILARPGCILLTPRDPPVAIRGHVRPLHQTVTAPPYHRPRGGFSYSFAGENPARHALAGPFGRRPSRRDPPVRARAEPQRAAHRDRDARPPGLRLVLPLRGAGARPGARPAALRILREAPSLAARQRTRLRCGGRQRPVAVPRLCNLAGAQGRRGPLLRLHARHARPLVQAPLSAQASQEMAVLALGGVPRAARRARGAVHL